MRILCSFYIGSQRVMSQKAAENRANTRYRTGEEKKRRPESQDMHQRRMAACSTHRVGELAQQGRAGTRAVRPSTITFTRTSVVLIRSTLIRSLARAANSRLATLVWLFMPTPKTESLATRGQLSGGGQPSSSACSPKHAERRRQIALRHGEADVRVPPAAHVLHDHVDHHAGLGHFVEDLRGQTGNIGHGAARSRGPATRRG